MKTNFRQRKCQNHDQECIAIDINPNCDPQKRHCCVKCLHTIQNQESICSYEDAEQYLNAKKKGYKYEKEIQNKKNADILEDVNSKVIEFKNFIVYQLDQLINSIEHQAMVIVDSSKKLEGELQDLDIDSFLSQKNEFAQSDFSYKGFQTDSMRQLSIIIHQESITEILNKLKDLDTRTFSLIPDKHKSQLKNNKQNMNLSFLCQDHKEEIRLFDLNDQTPKESRIACDECIPDKVGPFMPLKAIYKLWTDCQTKGLKKTNDFQDKTKKKIDSIQKELQLLQKDFLKKIDETRTVIEGESNKVFQKLQERLQSFEKEWNLLQREEITNIMEILSKPQPEEILLIPFEEELKKQDEEMNQVINECFNSLRKIERSFLENMVKQTNYDGKLIEEQEIKSFNDAESQSISCSQIQNQTFGISFYQKRGGLSLSNEINLYYKRTKPELRISESQTQQALIQQKIISLDIVKQIKIKKQPINYEIVNQNIPLNQSECYSITSSQDHGIMIAACNCCQINVFEFKLGQLRLIQTLSVNVLFIHDLYFMKKSNQFILGSLDGKIQIWSFNGSGYEMNKELTIDTHNDAITCIIMNQNEDLIISSSNDKSIKFWMKNNNYSNCFQTLIIHQDKVLCISLNESQNQLVSCGDDKKMNISQMVADRKWQLIQTIIINDSGVRINYIGNNIISFQMFNGNMLGIYQLNQINQQFQKLKEIQVNKGRNCGYFFKQKYIKQKSILCSKNGESINLISIKDNEFMVEQTINFNTPQIRGVITDDGEYLITWDINYKTFQVRQFH